MQGQVSHPPRGP
jgi:predicted aspartyl protease